MQTDTSGLREISSRFIVLFVTPKLGNCCYKRLVEKIKTRNTNWALSLLQSLIYALKTSKTYWQRGTNLQSWSLKNEEQCTQTLPVDCETRPKIYESEWKKHETEQISNYSKLIMPIYSREGTLFPPCFVLTTSTEPMRMESYNKQKVAAFFDKDI